MRTIFEMKQFITNKGFIFGNNKDIEKYNELMEIIENVLEKDEHIKFLYATTFLSTNSSANNAGKGIIAISNQKIYCAIKKIALLLKGTTLTTINPNEFNDIKKAKPKGFSATGIISIDFLTEKVDFYVNPKDVDEVYSTILQLLTDLKNNVDNKNKSSMSTVEEIKKYKELLDNEIITKEEFEAKKKQLLGI